MGVVAFCPQGHRVKVKDELAGRKGICPECGARFRIPAATEARAEPASARGRSAEDFASGAAPPSAGGLPVARFVSLDAELAATLPRALPLAAPPAGGPGG